MPYPDQTHTRAPDATATIAAFEGLLGKYGAAAPRYTSYPAIPFWVDASAEQAIGWMGETQASGDRSLSLYVHVPFCSRRCHFCACHVVITPHKEQGERYVAAVTREMALASPHLAAGRSVRQFHLGGGTPTFLDPTALEALVQAARGSFTFEDDLEMSIEVDPRTVDAAYLERLRRLGFNRISLGVQDFDPEVQAAVNRVQPYAMVAELVRTARGLGFASVNFDLIYGLPRQNRARFARTLEQVHDLQPDRLAIYHYAHLPQTHPHQRKIDPAALPGSEEKTEIFLQAREQLLAWGYRAIGLDHFARPDDDLMRAYDAGTLRRNFMGYTTQAGVDLLAFGLSAISEFSGSFWQNEKKLVRYFRALEAGRLPVVRGMALSVEDRLRKSLISGLFCTGRIDFDDVARRFGIEPRRHLAQELRALAPLAADGLVALSPAGVRVTPLGQMFLRNIAMVFDTYLKAPQAGAVAFSRTF